MGDSLLNYESDKQSKNVSLSLALPGLGVPQTVYTSIIQSLENLKIGVKCGLHTGNECHVLEPCEDVLKYFDGETVNIKFFDIESNSIVLPMEALMRQRQDKCSILVTNLGRLTDN